MISSFLWNWIALTIIPQNKGSVGFITGCLNYKDLFLRFLHFLLKKMVRKTKILLCEKAIATTELLLQLNFQVHIIFQLELGLPLARDQPARTIPSLRRKDLFPGSKISQLSRCLHDRQRNSVATTHTYTHTHALPPVHRIITSVYTLSKYSKQVYRPLFSKCVS